MAVQLLSTIITVEQKQKKYLPWRSVYNNNRVIIMFQTTNRVALILEVEIDIYVIIIIEVSPLLRLVTQKTLYAVRHERKMLGTYHVWSARSIRVGGGVRVTSCTTVTVRRAPQFGGLPSVPLVYH